MAQQIINVGTAPNDGEGDTLRLSQIKANLNFTELYSFIVGSMIQPKVVDWDGVSTIPYSEFFTGRITNLNDLKSIVTYENVDGVITITSGAEADQTLLLTQQ